MFDIGSVEVFVLLLSPLSGLLAAGYLAVALRRSSHRSQEGG